ncbi:MAG: ornithine cyclodeaminase family protein [Deltaproteobacteria bacterium]|nr:ornithine cyclodeaminase family protein [Deltaproteobacteria bacterium]
MKIRILTADHVREVLPMPKAIEAMKRAFGQLSAHQADIPLRGRLATEKGVTLLMPAYLHQSRELAIKIVSVYGDNPRMGLPTVAGLVMVLDPETGMPLALMEGTSLTAIRTGAAGGLAAELLSRKDAETVALFGAGVQGKSQLRGVMAVRHIRQVWIVDSSSNQAEKLADEIKSWPSCPGIMVTRDSREAVSQADIVIAATTSLTPLFNGNDLRPGTHVTGVGSFTPQMQEIDEITVRRARVVVDSREACMAEAGDLIIAGAVISAEIGEIVNGVFPPRRNDQEITFFKTVGVAVQDAAAAAAVLAEATERGLGNLVSLS